MAKSAGIVVFLSQMYELLWQLLALPDVHDTARLRAAQLVAMRLAPVKVSGTTGAVNQAVQKGLAALRLAPLTGSAGMARCIRVACQAICPGELISQEAPRT